MTELKIKEYEYTVTCTCGSFKQTAYELSPMLQSVGICTKCGNPMYITSIEEVE